MSKGYRESLSVGAWNINTSRRLHTWVPKTWPRLGTTSWHQLTSQFGYPHISAKNGTIIRRLTAGCCNITNTFRIG